MQLCSIFSKSPVDVLLYIHNFKRKLKKKIKIINLVRKILPFTDSLC